VSGDIVRPYLRLVRDNARTGPQTFRLEQVQNALLPITDNTLGVCAADGLDESILVTLITNLRPSLVLDLRTAPRFDFGKFNRRVALDLFESVGATYRDLGANQNPPADIVEVIVKAASTSEALLKRPASAVVLLDAGVDFEKVAVGAAQKLRDLTSTLWELVLFGPLEADVSAKQTVFISHANPEDNEFALWLEAQLTRLGYETWSDVSALRPGEVFWDSIEDTIRNKAAKVVAVVSRASMKKSGVLDEISLAVSVERTKQLNGFVLPIRVDDLPYSEFRANIARKNVIDFSGGWAIGLAQLIDAFSKDRVPRHRQALGLSLTGWWAQRKPSTLAVTSNPETLISNRFRVKALPKRLHSYSGKALVERQGASLPLVPLKGLWLSYYSDLELRDLQISGLTHESTFSAEDLFAGNVSLTNDLRAGDRQRLQHRLLNRHWETFLLTRGLRLYEMTGRQPTPFIPDGLLQGNTAHFVDVDGKQKRRLVVGYSTKRSVHWHLAPLGYFSTSHETTLNLKMRIVFSEDGQGIWPSVERMRTMRRGFCKNWWNDRWRSLQFALMAWLTTSPDGIPVYNGESGPLLVESAPMAFHSPVSIREDLAEGTEDETAAETDTEPSEDDLDEGVAEEDASQSTGGV